MDSQLPNQPSQQPVAPPPPPVPSSPIPKILLIVFAFLILAGTAAGAYILGTKQNQSQPIQKGQTATVPTPTSDLYREPTSSAATANWKTYTNSDLRIRFNYPDSWNELKVGGEPCFEITGGNIDYTKVVEKVNGEPCKHISITQNGHIFLATQSITFPDHAPGRGGYWGDGPAFEIRKEAWLPEQWLRFYCEESRSYVHRCTLQKNPHGISYVKSLEDIRVQGGSNDTALYYFLYKPNSPFPIISMSNQDLKNNFASEEVFDQILSTFGFD